MVMQRNTLHPVVTNRTRPLANIRNPSSNLAAKHGFSRHLNNEASINIGKKSNPDGSTKYGLSTEHLENQLHKLISWANDLLNLHGIQSISTDLHLAFADGVILIRLVEVLTSETIHGVTRIPVTKFQKERNIVKCLDFLTKKGVLVITDIKSQDLINGGRRSVFQLLNAIKMYYDSSKMKNGYPIANSTVNQNLFHEANKRPPETLGLRGQLPDVTANNLTSKQKETQKTLSYRERVEMAHNMKIENRQMVRLISSIPSDNLLGNSISPSNSQIVTSPPLAISTNPSFSVMNASRIFPTNKRSTVVVPSKQIQQTRENSFTPIKQTFSSVKDVVPHNHLLPKPHFQHKSYDNKTFSMGEDSASSTSSHPVSLLRFNSKRREATLTTQEYAIPGTVDSCSQTAENASDLLSIDEEILPKSHCQNVDNGSDTLSENEKNLLNYESVQSSSPVNAPRCSPALGIYKLSYPIGSQASLSSIEPAQHKELESHEMSMNGIYFPQVAVPPDLLTIKPLHQQYFLQKLASKKFNVSAVCDSDTATSVRSDGGRYDSVSEEQLDDVNNIQGLQRNVVQLQNMYHEMMRLLGVDQNYSPCRSVGIEELHKPTTRSSRQHSRQGRAITVRDFKNINKRLTKVETHVVTLAKSVMQLSIEVSQVHDILTSKMAGESLLPNITSNLRSIHPSLRYLRAPLSLRKLEWFFGENPPLLRNFLQDLGYTYVADILDRHKVTLSEFSCMSEDTLLQLGVPVGPSQMILEEVQRYTSC